MRTLSGFAEAGDGNPIAATPTNFGVQRVLPAGAWKPDPSVVLDAVASLGYDGISLGPPGYLGDSAQLRREMTARGLCVAEAFLPLHFARAHLFDEDRVAFRATLKLLAETADPVLRPVAVLSESFREAARWSAAGRIASHPELRLPDRLLPTLVANLHRAAEDCLDAGLTPAFHHHAGTFVETDDEIRRLLELVDGALVGLCLDTAHALLGGADPVALVQDYGSLIRDVHVKDISLSVVAASNGKEQDLTDLTQDGAFVPLGTGDAPVAEVVRGLVDQRYGGWMVIEQDRLLFEGSRIEDVTDDQRQNIAFLRRLLGS